jgi:hypothetical protein
MTLWDLFFTSAHRRPATPRAKPSTSTVDLQPEASGEIPRSRTKFSRAKELGWDRETRVYGITTVERALESLAPRSVR